MINPLGLSVHHITARVQDIDRATAWYQHVLGLQLLDRGERLDGAMRYADLEIPGFGVSLLQLARPATAVAPGQALVPSWVHIVFAVRDPPALYRDLRARGQRVYTYGPPSESPTSFLLQDSEGNEIEFVAAAGPQPASSLNT